MINFEKLNVYRENNRLEAKKAAGGLPSSIWETYSAFANTDGGMVLLGVGENPDRTLYAFGLEYPDKLVADFWNRNAQEAASPISIVFGKNKTGKVRILLSDFTGATVYT